ncbi:MFS transporter [Pseudoalteromonas peptidolytica]|uniref:MFS transporter n=1 Tax=Pseudoalteromonas peptidolytica TaxID=61150 RepID=UPI00298E667B|nr:MFS transporter [Pseudoalteromonas peptidolytica]MDW7548256.1 MFS transporter [Pseudoalteromonas peptidolytica]
MPSLSKNSEFHLHWVGVMLTQIGAYFTLIALPWLTLSVANNNPKTLAVIMACFGIPHSLFILLGGSIADKYSPLLVIKISRFGFALSTLLFALSLYLYEPSLVLLISFALFAGGFSALGFPANQSFIPRIVLPEHILKANVLTMGSSFVIQACAPVLVGFSLLGIKSYLEVNGLFRTDIEHLIVAFFLDAILVTLAACCTLKIRHQDKEQPMTSSSVFRSMLKSFQYSFTHPNLKIILLYLMLISILIHGPLFIMLPYLVKVTLNMDESALSYLLASQGIGTFIGATLVAICKPNMQNLGKYILVLDLLTAIVFIQLGFQSSLLLLCISLVAIGCAAGFTVVAGTTWYQLNVPIEKLSGAIALVLFAIHGLIPLSSMLLGTLLDRFEVSQITTLLGVTTTLICIIGLASAKIRNMGKVSSAIANQATKLKEVPHNA